MDPAAIVPLLAQALEPNDGVSEAQLLEWAHHLAATAEEREEMNGWRWRWARVTLPDGEGEALAIAQRDRPLLYSTALIAFDRAGVRPRFAFHPVVSLPNGATESWMLFVCDPLPQAVRATLEGFLAEGFAQAIAAADDWPMMRERASLSASLLPQWCGTAADPVWVRESQALLEWVASGHFVLLGCRDYQVETEGDTVVLRRIPGSGLGVLRDANARSDRSESFARLPLPARTLLLHYPEPILITQGRQRSIVHRFAYPSEILLWERDSNGTARRERRFVGLWTATAYRYPVAQIPLLRQKASGVYRALGAEPGSHLDRALALVLDLYPREEAFQVDIPTWSAHARAILRAQERRRGHLIFRRDLFGRFVSVQVITPREGYDTETRLAIQRHLERAFGAQTTDFEVTFTDAASARVWFRFWLPEPTLELTWDENQLGREVAAIATPWRERLWQAFQHAADKSLRETAWRRFRDGFNAVAQRRWPPEVIAADLLAITTLPADRDLWLTLVSAPPEEGLEEPCWQLRLWRRGAPALLAELTPLLESLGAQLREENADEITAEGERWWLHDLRLTIAWGDSPQREDIDRFIDAFHALWERRADADGYNRLVTLAGLTWREALLWRAYAAWLKQSTLPFSPSYLQETLLNHREFVRTWTKAFHVRFDPERNDDRGTAYAEWQTRLRSLIDALPTLDEERIARAFVAALDATVRTNFYRCDEEGKPRPWLAFKIASETIDFLPDPKPWREAFVFAPEVEGVHLRGGPVARGGLRWSDRRDDYRTEILGLMKAQRVKNALIVPVGAKGGFIVRNPPPAHDRAAWQQAGVSAYRTYLRGLLDLVDNRVGGATVPPPQVVRHDDDDPYFVVAADKGTATFSDIANSVAAEYRFWLGDAFASGGSVGYDHKKLGITARGAWVAIERHLRELAIDISTQPITVVGIGDMSGDVFGNGMLAHRTLKLIAAFDHRHIFLDPNPDPEASYRERERLFRLPVSSWDDYRRELLSAGGGIWPRTAKSIPISREARAALGLAEEVTALTPPELIQAILRAPVDLLYNGGIGTYVKASSETHAEVGDRANDAVRVDANTLRCRIVGEGGNLGFTQRARVEYALLGGRIESDAIHNSGGVDCSDHEVNLKIALQLGVEAGRVPTAERDARFLAMADDVVRAVLADNFTQTEAIALEALRGAEGWSMWRPFITHLAAEKLLDRRLERIPSDNEMAAREANGVGLTRPELAVLLAYAKLDLKRALLTSALLDVPLLAGDYPRYFPVALAETLGAVLDAHPLKREITATLWTNRLVDRLGIAAAHHLAHTRDIPLTEVVRAFAAVWHALALDTHFAAIDAAAGTLPEAVRYQMLGATRTEVARAMCGFLNEPTWREKEGLALPTALVTAARELRAIWEGAAVSPLTPARERQKAAWLAMGVPEPLATELAWLPTAAALFTLTALAEHTGQPLAAVAAVYWALHRDSSLPSGRSLRCEEPPA